MYEVVRLTTVWVIWLRGWTNLIDRRPLCIFGKSLPLFSFHFSLEALKFFLDDLLFGSANVRAVSSFSGPSFPTYFSTTLCKTELIKCFGCKNPVASVWMTSLVMLQIPLFYKRFQTMFAKVRWWPIWSKFCQSKHRSITSVDATYPTIGHLLLSFST